MVGQREAALERAGRNAAVDVIRAAVLALLALLAADDQHVLLGGDVDLVRLEAGDRQLDAIIVVAKLDQVERRIIFLALAGAAVLEHVEQPVEADGGAPIGRKVESTTHVLSSILSNKAGRQRRVGPPAPSPDPLASGGEESGFGASDFKTLWKTRLAPLGTARISAL